MSTVTQPGGPHDPQGKNDPFRYGWRYQKTPGPNGTMRFEAIPLTLADVLHPQEEDFIVQRPGHAEDCIYLHDVLQTLLGDTALVTFDLRIAWDVPDMEPLGPDVTVIFDGIFDPDRGTFDVATEGVGPTVVFEVVSPDTRVNDVETKRDEYHLAGVPYYVIIDALGFRDGLWDLQLIGYRYTPIGYLSMEPDDRGWLWVEPLRIYVAVRAGRVVCFNEAEVELLNHRDLSQARLQAEQLRVAAEQQRDAERQQRTAAEQQRDAAEQQRDAERQQRVAAEQQRDADRQKFQATEKALEERVRQLEAELRNRPSQS